MNDFDKEVLERIDANGKNEILKASASKLMLDSLDARYSYNFSWMGRPIIQYPQDMIAMQEIIWSIKPDLIIETGIAHGGSLIFSASMLELNAVSGGPFDGEVLGVDIDIRPHNRKAIEAHPMFKRISMIQGSSIVPEIITQVKNKTKNKKRILVFLDSNHTHDHVLAELEAYGPLTTVGSYCVVFDTIVEEMPDNRFNDRPWRPGNNPKTAVNQWLKKHPEFEIDHRIQNQLLITVAPGGYLKRVR